MRVSMFANADRYPGYWFSCELLLFFFFPLLLLIAGIDDDDGSSSSNSDRMFEEKEKKTTKYACKHTHIRRRVDHRMSLLVAATFLPCSLFLDQKLEKEKRDRERERKRMEEKKSFTQSLMPEDAPNFADWLVRACIVPEGTIGRKQRTNKYREKKSTQLTAYTSSFT